MLFMFMVLKCGSLCCIWQWQPFKTKLDEKSEALEKQLSARDVDVVNWVLKKGRSDMVRWMAINGQVSLKHLTCLLSTVLPSRESSYYVGLNGEGVKISLLSMMLLVEIAKVVNTATIQEDKVFLTRVLDEVFEIIHFIENQVNIGSSNDRLRFMLAKVIHKYGLASGLGEFILEQDWDLENCKVNFKLIQKPICGLCPSSDSVSICIQEEMSLVSDLISYRSNESSEVAYGRMEQLFVGMLHAFLAQLPVAVFTHILESPVEEYQERVRLGLGLMCSLQSIESLVRFSLPPGANITSLFHTQTSVTCPQVQGVSTLSPDFAQAVPDAGEIQEEAQPTE